jgi:hypothetical protein
MRKLLIVTGAVIAGAMLARRCASSCGSFDFDKMIERMPENAPPKWMFRNITAIRENSDRILELLERERPSADAEPERRAA